ENYARRGQSLKWMTTRWPGADSQALDAILMGLAKGWPRGKRGLTEEDEKLLVPELRYLSVEGRGHLFKLTSAWDSAVFAAQATEIVKSMLTIVVDEAQRDDARIAAVHWIGGVAAPTEETTEKLLAQITPRSSPSLNEAIVEALGSRQVSAPAVVKRLNSWSP